MRTYDDAQGQHWAEHEVKAVTGWSPSGSPQDIQGYEPTGPHRWFGYVLTEAAHLAVLRRVSETWRKQPPYPDLRYYTPMIRQRAEEMVLTSKLPPGKPLAQWFSENERLLKRDPDNQKRTRIAAAALLPLFEEQPEAWETFEYLDDFMSDTFAGYLGEWYAHAPKRLRPFVRRIAREFGINISGDENPQRW